MSNKFSVTLVVLALATNISVGVTKALTERGIQEYGPAVHISSSVLTFKENDGVLHGKANTAGQLLLGERSRFGVEGDNHNHQKFDAEISGYLKFLGVVGSGNIYVPEDETENHFGNINGGLLGASEWS